jgi:glycosyltransferase involved in cell wall biosynthesis
MQTAPLFSIAIPTYNRLPLLKKAVASALNQSYSNLEVVVFNNASTDGTKEWLETMATTNANLKIIQQPSNLGFAGNIHTIPNNIKGELVTVLSDDDWLEPDFAKTAIADLLTCDDATLWYCKTKIVYVDTGDSLITKDAPTKELGLQYVRHLLKGQRYTCFCSTVYKTATLRNLGGFLGNSLALDFSSRCLCAAQGMVLFNPAQLANYSSYKGNLTTQATSATWVASNFETFELIESKIGEKLRFACAYNAVFMVEHMFLAYNWRDGISCMLKVFRKYHFYFILALLFRVSTNGVRLITSSSFRNKVKQVITNIRTMRVQNS